MATPKRFYQENSFYHVFNRGNRKQPIFLEHKDYIRFLDKILTYKEKSGVQIISYCLMPNHFHFLIKQSAENQIQKFTHNLSTSYSKYFNIKYQQVGSVFQGRFKAKLVEREEYLIYLTIYIHLNPAGRNDKLADLIAFPWSSLSSFVTDRKDPICANEEVLSLIAESNQKEEYRKIFEEQLANKNFDKISHLLLDPAGWMIKTD